MNLKPVANQAVTTGFQTMAHAKWEEVMAGFHFSSTYSKIKFIKGWNLEHVEWT